MNKLRKLIISRFVDLQTLMGESYKEGITIDEINAFLSDKKFADLSKKMNKPLNSGEK